MDDVVQEVKIYAAPLQLLGDILLPEQGGSLAFRCRLRPEL